MSNAAITWVANQDIRPSGRKYVLHCLADYANGDGWCFPGQRTIAAYCSQDERTVRAHLAGLEADGWIRRERRFTEGGRQIRDGFVLLVPPAELKLVSHRRPEKSSAHRAAKNSAHRAGDLSAHRAEKFSGLGGESLQSGRKISPPHIDEPSLNPNITSGASAAEGSEAFKAPTEAQVFWNGVQPRLRKALDEVVYRSWVEQLEPLGLTSDEVTVEAPSRFHAEHVIQQLGRWMEPIVGRKLVVLASSRARRAHGAD